MADSISDMPAPSKTLHALYLAGPGDVINTFRQWRDSRDDATEVAATYSGQFFTACEKLGLGAHVLASRPHAQRVEEAGFIVEHRARPDRGVSGVRYHLMQLRYILGVARLARRERVKLVIASDLEHWWALGILKLVGVRVAPSLHCALWPAGHKPTKPLKRLILRLNGRFWRRTPIATICVSAECEKQIREVAGSIRGPIHVVHAQYRRENFANIPAPDWSQRPFRVMYAGRIEQSKGVFDILTIARSLRESGHDAHFEICGDGGALPALRTRAESAGLQDLITFRGRLDSEQMREAYGRSSVVLVPTRSSFAEGLNKVAVEGALAHRPVVVSRVCPAWESLGDAAIDIEADDVEAYTNAIRRLMDDRALYERMVEACAEVESVFYNPDNGWGAAMERVLKMTMDG